MPRDATATRDRLVRAGEQLFAAEGIHRARTRDIVEQAGQSNDSAIAYHFGSRDGLLAEIVLRHVRDMEDQRARELAALAAEGREHDLRAVTRALLNPTGARLLTPDGRDFLRIMAQVARLAPIGDTPVPSGLEGTHLLRQIQLFEQCLDDHLPPPLVTERIAMAIAFITTTLADRATVVATGGPPSVGHQAWMDNLLDMVVGALAAPHTP